MDIKKLMLPIDEFTQESDVCFAHVSNDGEQKETLREHTERCQKYWMNIVCKKNIDKIFQRFEDFYLEQMSEEAKNIFEEMTVNIVSAHDLGKINPKFQQDKMKHVWKKERKPDQNIGSKHSILSSIFYLDYFLEKINQTFKEQQKIEKSEAEILKDFAYIYAYIISRHHGEMNEFEKYMAGLVGKQVDGENLGERARTWCAMWKKEVAQQGEMQKLRKSWKNMLSRMQKDESRKTVYLYGWTKLQYSLLVTADYYATTEFMNNTEMLDFGELENCEDMVQIYESGNIQKEIRKYAKEKYPMNREELEKVNDINILRAELFLDAERTLKEHLNQSIYYLEAPTGSGKSNIAMNLSFQLIQKKSFTSKIFYIYPFNTLVEQNIESLRKVFGQSERIMMQIAVVNSLAPIKEDEEENEWNKILLDRQFLNYPIVLSTHVMLFRMMFGHTKEDVFGFHQLCHSVIVLDEIQSYRNEIWSEIITFLKGLTELLDIKIIIMSATLPNLEILTDNKYETVRLIKNRNKYFNHPKFSKRVIPNYHLLEQKMSMEHLTEKIMETAGEKKKILIEFIKKKSAEECYRILHEESETPVFLMTGDSSILDRKKIIQNIEAEDTVILVATQVIEAGVDIDMDIGYKDISKLDSEEQFMGRINRSGKKSGVVYFFDLDDAEKIYKNDKRVGREKTLINDKIKRLLTTKDFSTYYEKEILPLLFEEKRKLNDKNLEDFFMETVGALAMPQVDTRMKLIDDNRQLKFVYFGREIEEEGMQIDGRALWEEYKQLMEQTDMEYAEKKVKLHNIRSKMNAFIYQLGYGAKFVEDEQIGEIYYIEEGEAYFDENGILNRDIFEEGTDLFI